MQGLGDNIFQRTFVKTLARQHEVTLETSWPELYADLPVKFCNPDTRLRTQAKNVGRSKVAWVPRPIRGPNRRISYINALRTGRSIISGMEECFGIKFEAADFGLPPLPPSSLRTDKPIAFVRPVTTRREWFNSARNPLPEYIAQLVEWLRPSHHIVVVADIMPGEENPVGDLPKGDSNFIRGELPMMSMLALMASSDIIIGGVGFIVPASLALRHNCFIVYGGNGGHNAPNVITDPSLNCSRLGFATPENFCRCTNMRHNCPKTIADLSGQWSTYCRKVGLNALMTSSGMMSASAGFPSPPAPLPMIRPISIDLPGRPTAISAVP
jgi:hypothetical protein